MLEDVFNLTRPPLVVANPVLMPLISASYTSSQLERVRLFLAGQGTFDLEHYPGGGASAVTVLVHRPDKAAFTLANALGDNLIHQWERDRVMVSLAEHAVVLDATLAAGTVIQPGALLSGLSCMIKHHLAYNWRFTDILNDEGVARDFSRRPHISCNAVNGRELERPWNHAQNDALGMLNYLMFFLANKFLLPLDDEGFRDGFERMDCLLHAYFWKIRVWSDKDAGAWETESAWHWSSVYAVALGLAQQLKWAQGKEALARVENGLKLSVDAAGIEQLLHHCLAMLAEANGCETTERMVDLAQLNPILLAVLADEQLLSDDVILSVLLRIERELVGPIGVRRFAMDTWDGRSHRSNLQPGEEAEWTHGNAMLSIVWGSYYQRTRDSRFADLQTYYFNRALAALSERLLPPESWLPRAACGQWRPNENEPLAWSQSMLLLAFASMKASLAVPRSLGRELSAATALAA